MTINDTAQKCFDNAKAKGFWDNRDINNIHSSLAELALIHSEVSEATEALRNNDVSNFAEELADICIRVFDTAAARGINLEECISQKMEQNAQRPRMHGGKLA